MLITSQVSVGDGGSTTAEVQGDVLVITQKGKGFGPFIGVHIALTPDIARQIDEALRHYSIDLEYKDRLRRFEDI